MGNRIEHLNKGVFMGIASLDKFALEKNNIQIFTYLSNNPLSVLPSGAFKGLVSLESLYLINANIKDSEDGAFADLKTVQGT